MTGSRVAIVTGGAGGIGRAIARRLAAERITVVVADLDLAAAERVAAEVDGEARGLDVRDRRSADGLVADVMAAHGRIDILVNNAGIHVQKLVVEMTDADWDRIQAINARGPFLMCRAVAPHMMRAEAGRIINIVTKLGFGNPYSSAYMASKNAVWGFTQCLAMELAPYNVTVNAVAPGHVGPGTGFEHAWFAKAEKLGLPWPEFERQVLKTIPLGRWCKPEDVAAAVAYVVSDGAAFMTAELLSVAGGFTGYATTPPKAPPPAPAQP